MMEGMLINVIVDGRAYTEMDIRRMAKDAARWRAFRDSKVTKVEFEDIACHKFRNPPQQWYVDNMGDVLVKQWNRNLYNTTFEKN